MRYRLPEDCAGVTLNGVTLPTKHGFIEADADAALALAPHGIVPTEPAVPNPGETFKGKRTKP